MIDLQRAVVYDVEVFPNLFSIYAEELNSDVGAFLQISEFADDRQALMQWFNYLQSEQVPMIGFNNLGYDLNIIDAIYRNPNMTYADIFALSKSIINQPHGSFRKMIWESDRFAPQIDLFKIHHFDNKAKSTSLKALEINMRSRLVLEAGVSFDEPITLQQLNEIIKPYNVHDVRETKRFAQYSMSALEFRNDLSKTLDGDVLNFNDTKIGAKILEQRLGRDACYVKDASGRNQPRQTPRNRIALNDIIFPYIRFQHAEFQRVLDWMRTQVLTPEDLDDPDATIKTKGAFSGVKADVGGIEFWFGTGGIHGSVLSQRFQADDEWLIRDVDVTSLYPNIAIVNRLAPEHLGERFTVEYAKLPVERKRFQQEFGKKSVPANSMKLASNGTYGNSNNKFSPFYDPKLTMQITINGQLMLCMLAEQLLTVPTLQIIQINTDGITYRIHASCEPQAAAVCEAWSAYTMLNLEDVNYSRMWIRDVNSYVAEDLDGKLKIKGAYWAPDMGETYAKSITEAQPPAWHKNLSACVVQRAAVAAMVHGVDPETYIRCHTEPFDFICRAKVDRASRLMLGDVEIQGTSRYYVAIDGAPLRKISPPVKGAKVGDYKRRNGLSDMEYQRVLSEVGPGVWDARIHTVNKSRYEIREMSIEAGWNVAECNNADNFRFDNVDYKWYVNEASKLIVR